MNTNRSSLFDAVRSGAEDDSEVVRILDAYLSGIEAGQPADPEKLLAENSALAGRLRAYLEVMNLAGELAEDSSIDSVASFAEPSTAGSTLPHSSLPSTLDFGHGPPPQIHLHELPYDGEPLVMPRSAEMPGRGTSGLGRYQLQGEIARGGMGAILRGRDVDLGRELAIKVLLESHRGDSDAVRRFVEEAQIGGQLQHPGIVPVYELGTFPDRRPFFAMKLVKGRTLAALLRERQSQAATADGPGSVRRDDRGTERDDRGTEPPPTSVATLPDLPRLLAIFEQICQTMAYAHARGVIHRDLKPSNVMVGSFGEVQVMDWGLAKVLPTGGIADEETAAQAIVETIVTTIRSGSSGSGSESQAGSVLGTPSYMAPEQARGEVDRIDERADVFGLGAILCEILTGSPPFVGSTREELRARAARGELTDALRRLDASAADTEVIELARDCLAAERERRPRNAGEVTRRVTTYLMGVQERLRTAELARVEAQARADEAHARARIERSRRHRTVALAASILVTAGLAGAGWTYLEQQRQVRAVRFNQAIGEVDALLAEANRAVDDLARWQAAGDAARAAERLLVDAPDSSTRSRAKEHVRGVIQAAAAAQSDHKLLTRLGEIRSAGTIDDPDGSTIDAEYGNAFEDAGIDVSSMSSPELAATFLSRPLAVRTNMAAALDHWAAIRQNAGGDEAGARQLTEAARRVDPDPWRNKLRDLRQTTPGPERLTALKNLARSRPKEQLPPLSLHMLAMSLERAGDLAEAEAVLREGQRRFPGDVRMNLELAACLAKLARPDESIRYYMAARALRPEWAHDLAHALEAKGETEDAIALFRDLAQRSPNDVDHLLCLGVVLKGRGRGEAKSVFDAAIRAARAEVELKPVSHHAHEHLGGALALRGRLDGAIAEYREAVRLKPDSADTRDGLARALRERGNLDEAITEYRAAIRLKPDLAESHCGLGLALQHHGEADKAIAEYRAAIQLKPDFAMAHANLGGALVGQGNLNEAMAECKTAIRLDPNCFEGHINLGIALSAQDRLDEAMAEFRAALRVNPNDARSHHNLGHVLGKLNKPDAAIAEFRTALRLDPGLFQARNGLGIELKRQGRLDEAIAELRTALRLKPNYEEAHSNLGDVLRIQGKLEDAIVECRTAVRLKPSSFESHTNLGNALSDQGKLDEAIAEYRHALRLQPDLALCHFNLGVGLSHLGKLDEACSEYRAALRLEPKNIGAHIGLGEALERLGIPSEAIEEFRTAIRLTPDSVEARVELGQTLYNQGRLGEAIAELREAVRLKPDRANAHADLAFALRGQGKLNEAIAEYRTAVKLEPNNAATHFELGNTLSDQAILDEAIAEFRTSIRLRPDHAEAHCNLGNALCRQGSFVEALPELIRGHELGSKRTDWRYPSAQWVREAERLVELDRKLPGFLGGHDKPAGAPESLALAQMCYGKRLHGASAGFWAGAFQAQPNSADDMNVQNRYNAACAAALAGSGEGKDEPPLDDAKKAHWRKQAVEWLIADLAAWSKILASGPPQAKPFIIKTLQHWKADPDLAGLRDAGALAKLAGDEQKACRALWAEVDALLAKADGADPKSVK